MAICNYHPKLVEHVVHGTNKTILGVLITSLIIFWVYKDFVPLNLLITWALAQSLFLYLRYVNSNTLKKLLIEKNEEKIRVHTKYILYLMFYSVLLWNIIALLSFIYAPSNYVIFTLLLASGLVTAAIISLSALINIYHMYFILLMFPQGFYLYNKDGSIYDGAFLLTFVVYIPFIFLLIKSVNKNLILEIKNNEELEEKNNELYKVSITDMLTNVYNRRYFFEATDRLIELSKREDKSISLLMIDVDYFKKINDKYGHDAGDTILVNLASKIQSMTRNSDIFARMGGEEFSLFLYNTSIEEAKNIANNLCQVISSEEFTYEDTNIGITVSIGVAQLSENITTIDKLYKAADSKLYEAKNLGRNQVC